MRETRVNSINKIIVTVSFLIMVTVNALANILPLAGVTSGEVSDSYPNLFAPAGLTFSIWGLIYLLLALHTLYHLGLFRKNKTGDTAELLNKTGIYFTISSLANAMWIFAWHYEIIPVSLILIIIILICLIMINAKIRKHKFTTLDAFFIRLPFRVYFGWITVATIANVTTYLVSIGWDGFSVPEQTWTVIILIVGALIGIAVMIKNNAIAYGLVFIWAYVGILVKHTSSDGFDGQYRSVIITLIICLLVFVVTEVFVTISRMKETKNLNA